MVLEAKVNKDPVDDGFNFFKFINEDKINNKSPPSKKKGKKDR